MFRHAHGSDTAREIAAIERLLRELQVSLGRLTEAGARSAVTRAGAAASGAANYAGDAITTAGDAVTTILNDISERLLGRARSVSGEAAKFGGITLRKIGDEVESRPVLALAIAAGVGFLLASLASRR